MSTVITLVDKEQYSLGHSLFIAPVLGGVVSKLPDIIEPAFHPNHRQFFHSVTMLTLLSAGLLKAYRWSPEEPLEKFIRGAILICGAAYLSHLICDASTPKGLPLVGKF
ncbi:metal-dependent hydrolase [Shewanella yunxiaonensis]|uniref:Metal-dependent hydrolase n=2 Tax=Shewanella yunxiaonensis TaxID=2829809 RepID=A0ABX7YPX1_9GAMM|nr:metal-dependent hydrolase [Shewanella yunxiaonensis]